MLDKINVDNTKPNSDPTIGQAVGEVGKILGNGIKNTVKSIQGHIELQKVTNRLTKLITSGEMPDLPPEFADLSDLERAEVLKGITLGVSNSLSRTIREQNRVIETLKTDIQVLKDGYNSIVDELNRLTVV